MTSEERKVLMRALSSLSCVLVDTHIYASHRVSSGGEMYDYSGLGRQVMGKRLLAEIIGIPQSYMLPGEFYEDESDLPGLLMYTPDKRSAEGEPLINEEKKWLQTKLLPVLAHISGVSDSDDAVLRCIRREVAEVAGYPNLSHFRLLYEKTVGPLYFKSYDPLSV